MRAAKAIGKASEASGDGDGWRRARAKARRMLFEVRGVAAGVLRMCRRSTVQSWQVSSGRSQRGADLR